MEYRTEEKQAFKVMGVSRNFSYGTAETDIPRFWDEIYIKAAEKPVPDVYGFCFDEKRERSLSTSRRICHA